MTVSPQSRFRLPHWGWFLLVTLVLVVGFVGLSVWLPYHREQQVIQRIESWGGRVVGTKTDCPEWLLEFFGEHRMATFKAFERVVGIELEGTEITDSDLVRLTECKSLELLGIERTAVTDAGLDHLKLFSHLRGVGLSGTAVTDAGLAYLSGLTQLESIHLKRTKVTNVGLAHLRGLANLQILRLDGTAVTHKGVIEFQKAVPGCEIYFWGREYRRGHFVSQ
jgi:hypothetical protein